jgi:hypothetical protein
MRPNEMDAVSLQQSVIASRRRVRPHARVHGGRNEHGLVGGEKHGARQIVGMATGHFGKQIRGRGARTEKPASRARRMSSRHL